MHLFIYKILFILGFTLIGYYHPPFGQNPLIGALLGVSLAAALIILVVRIKRTELQYIWSSMMGLISGILIGGIMDTFLEDVIKMMSLGGGNFFRFFFLFGIPITGLLIGLTKPAMFTPMNIKEFFRGSSVFTDSFLLDTSAIIDGRILQIANSGFLEGEFIITQFVLAELQLIADSPDQTKKVRGKRGLDVIDQLKKSTNISVTILNKGVPGANEVDQKLVLLGKENNFKIITNDVNLSKIANLQEVKVLNVNELAFALKPIVYPGENLKVLISKEGKEKKQGIAYLDDGTMIVIDEAKNEIGKKLSIEVTSVLQTTSGKMIFGKKLHNG